MGLVELIQFLVPVLIPTVLLVALEAGNIIILVSMIARYPHIILSRWDVAMILLFVIGFFFFDSILLLFGHIPQDSLVALSRVNRLVMLMGLGWVMHAAMRRQELMKEEANGGG